MCLDSMMGGGTKSGFGGKSFGGGGGMGDLGTAILIGGIGETIMSGISSFTASRGNQQEMQHRANIALQNANLKKLELKDVDRRKLEATNISKRQTNRLNRTKRAKRSGGGLDINFGAPLEDMLATELFGVSDQGTIAINAEKEKVGIRSGIKSALLEAEFRQAGADAESPFLAGAGEISAGATKVAGKWYKTQQLLKLGKISGAE